MEETMKMRKAFELVAPVEDWKGPINKALTREEIASAGTTIEEIKEAVLFMTATTATVIYGSKIRVTAPGYRAGPAW